MLKSWLRCQISHAKLLSLSSTSSNQWPFGLEANGAKGYNEFKLLGGL
jgi:hypothetical protein